MVLISLQLNIFTDHHIDISFSR